MNYKFLIDPDRCLGCSACEAACKEGYDLEIGIRRRKVVEIEHGSFPNVKRRYFSMACFHCDDAPCMRVCRMNAIYKREDGIVLVNKNLCVGCGYCLYACPFGEPQFKGSGVFGTKGKMDKCTLCYDRLEKGLLPLCVQTCIGEAIIVGDIEELLKIKEKRANAIIWGYKP